MRLGWSRWILVIAGGALLPRGAPAQEIHLKTRDLSRGAVPAREGTKTGKPQRSGSVHQIVQFDHTPGVEDLDALMTAGAAIVAMVPDNAVMVTTQGLPNLKAAGVTWTGILEAADKLSPQLPSTAQSGTPIEAVIEFHSDVTAEIQQSVLSSEGALFARPAALLANHVIVDLPFDKLRELAARDEVAYIFPADAALRQTGELMPCAGMLTMAGAIAQYANAARGWELDADLSLRLGYAFGTMPPKVPAATVQGEILRALAEWSRVTNVIFHPAASGSASRTIYVKFASGQHGDAYPFDGPGGILAHTFYPVPVNPESIAGDMHLDADESWHAGGDIDIYSVALHESGHALGLVHSDKPGDVMYPYYRRGMQLSSNDIAAVQALYGKPGAAPAPVTSNSAVPQLTLTVHAAPAGTAAQISLAGGTAGGVPPLTVQWQSDQGYSGAGVVDGSTWSAQAVNLSIGTNTLTVTVLDSAHHKASQTIEVARSAATPAGPSAPPSISIKSPAAAVMATSASSISLSGISASASGVTRVNWQTSSGASGTATGTDHWVASNVPLLSGTNTIIVRAFDAKGTNAWASVVAVRN